MVSQSVGSESIASSSATAIVDKNVGQAVILSLVRAVSSSPDSPTASVPVPSMAQRMRLLMTTANLSGWLASSTRRHDSIVVPDCGSA